MRKININSKEFIEYYYNHSREETARHFGIGTTTVGRLKKKLNLSKAINKVNWLIDNKDTVINYYLSCRTMEECCYHFEVSRETFCRFLKVIKYHKPKDLVHNSIWNSKNENKSFNSSSTEEKLKHFLLEKFGYDDVFYNYNGDLRYPYHCDFYIKSLDLFIELNLFMSHGEKPFDELNPDDFKLLDKYSSSPENWIEYRRSKVWGSSDRAKIKVAKDNNLNYIAIYPYKGKVTKFLNVYKLNQNSEWDIKIKISDYNDIFDV